MLIKACACLNCGKMLDAATSAIESEQRPRPGDITICIYCGLLMAFANDLSFRELTDEEMIDAAGDKRLITIQKARKMIREEKSRH